MSVRRVRKLTKKLSRIITENKKNRPPKPVNGFGGLRVSTSLFSEIGVSVPGYSVHCQVREAKRKIGRYLPSKMRLLTACDYFFVVSGISANFDTLLALSIANGAIS